MRNVQVHKLGDELFAATPLADVAADIAEGYAEFDREETVYLHRALEAFPAEIETWYRALTLLNRSLRFAGDPAPFLLPTATHDDERAYQTKLRLAGVAAGTSKMALEAILVGRYGQAYALLRHIFETWRIMVYLGIHPEMARAWLVVNGDPPVNQPGEGAVIRALRRWAKAHKDLDLASQIDALERIKATLDAGAHPTRMTVQQTFHPTDDSRVYLAAGFDRTQAMDTFILGVLANIFLLDRVIPLTSVDPAARDAIEPVRSGYINLLERRLREVPE